MYYLWDPAPGLWRGAAELPYLGNPEHSLNLQGGELCGDKYSCFLALQMSFLSTCA